MLFSYRYGQQQITDNKKCRQIAGNFDCHMDAVVQHGAHRPKEHVQGFTLSHWMPSSLAGSVAILDVVNSWF